MESDPPWFIRRAIPDDVGALTALHVASRRSAYRGLMPDRLLDGDAVEQERARLWLARLATPEPEERTWVALEGDALLGFAVSGPARDPDQDPRRAGEVTSIYLDPSRIGLGVGRAPFEHTLDDLRARAASRRSCCGSSRATRGRRASTRGRGSRPASTRSSSTTAWPCRT